MFDPNGWVIIKTLRLFLKSGVDVSQSDSLPLH
jgi:hypothetical protein